MTSEVKLAIVAIFGLACFVGLLIFGVFKETERQAKDPDFIQHKRLTLCQEICRPARVAFISFDASPKHGCVCEPTEEK